MAKLKLEEVFKVGGIPTVTFVEPVEYQALLVALRTPGRGVVVEGPSGIGKTTSVLRALEDLDLRSNILQLSARKRGDIDLIRELPGIDAVGTVLIDDFHKLDDVTKKSIADFMKVLADEERRDSKIVILGINQAGQSLINFATDLTNRLEIIRFEANPIEKVESLLGKGEAALKIILNVKDDIARSAHGSFYIAQMLAHQTCIDSGIIEEQDSEVETLVSFELVRGKVFDRLSRSFMGRTSKFAQGTRLRREGRAPYLHLLYWLASSDEWTLSIERAVLHNPEFRGSVIQIVEKGYLKDLIEKDVEISSVLHYESTSRLLTVEDPQYIYFLKNISWKKFAADLGFMALEFRALYDFALSFAGPDRTLAEALFSSLSEMEFEVFYDKNEQHRILAEDVEDYLRPIYLSDAQFVIVLLGPEYPKRVWTRFESQQFAQRFKQNAVIPVWFKNAPPGIFDESSRVGGITFDPDGNTAEQVTAIADLCRRKMADIRRGVTS
jgi:hypothetical protein